MSEQRANAVFMVILILEGCTDLMKISIHTNSIIYIFLVGKDMVKNRIFLCRVFSDSKSFYFISYLSITYLDISIILKIIFVIDMIILVHVMIGSE